MAQVTDRNIGANPTGFDMRTEINNIIAALESDNSGSSAPLNTVAYMKWLDTSNATYYYIKERNHDNTAWITLFRYTVATKIMEAVSNGVVLNDVVVHKTGNETIVGVKTFSSSPIVPNATTATQAMAYGQGVNLTAYQTIAGVKTFASSPLLPVPTLANQAISMGNIIEKTSAGIGYGTGSGGTVTQLTNKGTAVELNKPCGKITTSNSALTAGQVVPFYFYNNLLTASDNLLLHVQAGDGGGGGNYNVWAGNGDVAVKIIMIKNIATFTLSDSLVINFAIIKGATA